MISYSPSIETVRLSCTVFEIRRVIWRNSLTSIYLTRIWRFRGGWFRPNFEKKLLAWENYRVPGLSCGVVCVFICLAILVEHRLVTDTHRHTDTGHGIYRAEHSLRGKNLGCEKKQQKFFLTPNDPLQSNAVMTRTGLATYLARSRHVIEKICVAAWPSPMRFVLFSLTEMNIIMLFQCLVICHLRQTNV